MVEINLNYNAFSLILHPISVQATNNTANVRQKFVFTKFFQKKIAIKLSLASDFQSDVAIGAMPLNVVGIEVFFVAAFQNMAAATQLTVVPAPPFIEHECPSLLPCRCFYSRCSHIKLSVCW